MISVCVATYNGEKFIKEQLQSILSQLSENDEVIVSDDGSTDSTCQIVENMNDKRITLLHTCVHDCRFNFQNALMHAKGDIIFLSDQDDVWLENKVKICVEELKTYDLVATNSMETDEHLNVINPDFFKNYNSGPGIIKNALVSTYYGSCMAFRATLLKYALPFPKTKEIGHDQWLGLVAEMTGRVKFVKTPYLLYRRHENTETNSNSNLLTRSKRSLWAKIRSRFVVFHHIISFKLKKTKVILA